MGNKSSSGSGPAPAAEAMPAPEELAKLKPAGRKGWALRVEASKKLASRSPFGREDRLEAAAELSEQAATQFKLAKMYEDAAACYQMQAGARTRMSEDMQACNALTSAFEMYAKSDAIEEGYEAASTAIEKYKDAGKFDRAAKLLQKVAEVSVSSQPRWRKIPSLGRTARSRHRRAVARNAQPMFPRPVSSLFFSFLFPA